MLAPSGGGLILYQAYGNLYAMTGRNDLLLEDKQIPSVGVFDEVFSTWMVAEDGVAGIKRCLRDLYSDGVRNFATASGRGSSVSKLLSLEDEELLDILERLGYAMPNELGVSLILNSLNKGYDQFVQNYNMHSMGKTIAELHAMLKLHEKGAKGKDKGKNKLTYTPKPKIPPPPKRYNLAKDSICHHCKEVGHWRRNYPSYQAELKKIMNASVASTSCIFTIELYVFPNKTWVYDMGCGTHICNTLQGLRESKKLKHEALSLYMGNEMCAAVEAIRSFDLILPSGLIIVLDNCHFAPSVTRTVSREGASYFITFTDDFSHYGYVYLMKHKHEVFETFKVFQNEVENQLGKKIKAIRSDRGGEYLTRILNMVPTKKVERTPYEIWHGKAPKLSYLRVWGCEALVKRDAPDKLDPRSIKCIFVGYPKETMGYYFYYPLENKIFVARNAEFFENSLMVQEASGSHGLLESSGSDGGLELIQEEDTQPSENTSEIHNEVAPIEVEPQNVKVPIRRSARIPQAQDEI
ncbi:retrotransposon protein, putative, ty1-copia subclass [Tanacetum coccineum]